jgi:hypothetical protein
MAPRTGVRARPDSRAAAIPATATPATETISAIWNPAPTVAAPSAPAEELSRPIPTTTPLTASHSRQLSRTPISQAANTAVTARFDAMTACTANSGSRCSATSWAMNPIRSMPMLATKRHWPSSRTSRPGSTRPAAGFPSRSLADRRLAERIAMACMTAAIP